jgi:hypothetical protein
LNVRLLAWTPRRFRTDVSVGTALDDVCDTAAEFTLDLVKLGGSALVLDSIVKERRNRFVFAPAVLEHK